MNPRDFLHVASNLTNGATPAEFRTAISRAYYAVFNVGVEVLEGMGCNISKSPTGHAQVSHSFNNSGNVDLEKISTKLGRLRTERNYADYHLDRQNCEDQKNAKSLVQQAARMVETIDRCISGPQRKEIIQAIKDYNTKIGR